MNIVICSYNLRTFDGVGNSCLYHRNILNSFFNADNIYLASQSTDIDGVLTYKDVADMSKQEETILFYHHSIFDPYLHILSSGTFAQAFVYFHGITPPKYLHGELKQQCSDGLSQITSLQSKLPNVGLFTNSYSSYLQIDSPSLRHLGSFPPTLNSFAEMHRSANLSSQSHLTSYYVGRVSPAHKNLFSGLSHLFHVFNSLDRDLSFYIYTSENESHVNDMLAGSIFRDRIHIHSCLSDADLHSSAMKHDFLFSPSLHEGFCIPVYQALMHRQPVVSTNLPCYSSYPISNIHFMYNINYTESLSKAIKSLLHSPSFTSDQNSKFVADMNELPFACLSPHFTTK